MISVYQLKPAFQNLLDPLTRRLAEAGVSANQVTVSALLLSLLGGSLLALFPGHPAPLLALPVLLLLRMGLNAIDGMLARNYATPTPLGAVLNELGDVVSDIALYWPLALLPGVSAGLFSGLVLLVVLTEFLGVVAIQIRASRRYDGPFGKSDRALVFGALGLLLGLGVPVGGWLNALLVLLIALALLTCYQRVRRALQEVTV